MEQVGESCWFFQLDVFGVYVFNDCQVVIVYLMILFGKEKCIVGFFGDGDLDCFGSVGNVQVMYLLQLYGMVVLQVDFVSV